VDGSLKVVKRFIEILLVDPNLSYLKQGIPRKLLVWPLLRGCLLLSVLALCQMWDVGCGVLDDLLEMKNRLILQVLLPQDLALIVMSLSIFVILFELLIKVDESLIVVLQLVQKYGPL
jgi:hypothetical protein